LLANLVKSAMLLQEPLEDSDVPHDNPAKTLGLKPILGNAVDRHCGRNQVGVLALPSFGVRRLELVQWEVGELRRAPHGDNVRALLNPGPWNGSLVGEGELSVIVGN